MDYIKYLKSINNIKLISFLKNLFYIKNKIKLSNLKFYRIKLFIKN